MSGQLDSFLKQAKRLLKRVEPLLPPERVAIDWQLCKAARWQQVGRFGQLVPMAVNLSLQLDDLQGLEQQRMALQRNTLQLLQGYPTNHALLWGARGTGKSSLVRALLAAYVDQGLRLIEVEREGLEQLPRIVEGLAGLPYKFIVFCDDLSFEAGEGDYRILKSVLDGSLEQAPDNVVLYATSNRRHLVPERQTDNANWQQVDGEIHPSEAVEDKIALSDRFGLWLSFYPFTQAHYLEVVYHWIAHWAAPAGLVWERSQATDLAAIQWATQRGNRNGRCAAQFAKFWVGQQLLDQALTAAEQNP